MRKIKTKIFGEVSVSEDLEISFKNDIFGYENYHKYYLLEIPSLPNFFWLQSSENPDVAIFLTDPANYYKGYVLDMDDDSWRLLNWDEGEEILTFAVVNTPEDVGKMTMNLLGPIVINASKKIGIQGMEQNDDYGPAERLFADEILEGAFFKELNAHINKNKP